MLNEAKVKTTTTPGKQNKKQGHNIQPQRTTHVKSIAERDGVDHINVDNNHGKTELGRMLANFPRTPFTHPEYGPFASIEGFWHWIRAKEPSDDIRGLHGNRARAFGRKQNNGVYVDNFKEEIIKAIYYKVIQNNNIFELLVQSTLPFKYYYIFGPHNLEISPDYANWLCDGIEQVREHVKKHGKSTNIVFDYIEK